MRATKLFRNGNSQAIRIPADLAYTSWNIDLEIERSGDELRIRPAARRLDKIMSKWAAFSPDFMQAGREKNQEAKRDAL